MKPDMGDLSGFEEIWEIQEILGGPVLSGPSPGAYRKSAKKGQGKPPPPPPKSGPLQAEVFAYAPGPDVWLDVHLPGGEIVVFSSAGDSLADAFEEARSYAHKAGIEAMEVGPVSYLSSVRAPDYVRAKP